MKNYWYLFLAAIFCALFSKQIDALMVHIIKEKRKRVIFFHVFCVSMLLMIGLLLYHALHHIP